MCQPIKSLFHEQRNDCFPEKRLDPNIILTRFAFFFLKTGTLTYGLTSHDMSG